MKKLLRLFGWSKPRDCSNKLRLMAKVGQDMELGQVIKFNDGRTYTCGVVVY